MMRNGGTAIWQGFDFHWANTPHRLHHLGSWLDELDTQDGKVHGACQTSFTVGRVPDSGVARTLIAPIRSEHLKFLDGEQTLSLYTTLGSAAETRGERVVIPLPEGHTGTAILRGFHLRCVSHDMGLHPEGLGIRLTRITTFGGELSFVPVFFCHPTNSPDLVTQGTGEAFFECDVRYAVVVSPKEQVKLTVPCGQKPCVTHQHRRGQVTPLSHRVVGRVDPKLNRAVMGVRGFRWQQHHQSYFRRNGRFIRRFQVNTGATNYSAEHGASEFKPALHFCNNGMVPYPIDARHQLWTTMIQYGDERPALEKHVEEHTISTGVGEGGIGRSRFTL